MRLAFLFFGVLAACAPSPPETCKRFDELDKEKPMPRFGEHELSNRPRPSKLDGCTKELVELNRVDSHAYRSAARCIERAKTSSESWNCFVMDHLSKIQAVEKAKLLACNARSERTRVACTGACSDDHCRALCSAAYEDALTECQFN